MENTGKSFHVKQLVVRKVSSLTLRYSIGFTLFAIVTMGIAYSLLGIQEFKQRAIASRKTFLDSHKAMAKAETLKVIEDIALTRQNLEENMKEDLKMKTFQAWDIMNSIYINNKEKYTDRQIKDLVKDALRPVRFNYGRGYYFMVSMDGTEELYPVAPQFEGQNLLDLQDEKGAYVIRDEISIARESGEGFVTDYWTKPGSDSLMVYPKISFIKYFEPLNVYVGCGEYLDNKEKDAQEEVKARVRNISFGKDGYLFIDSFTGHAVVINSEKFKAGDYIGDLVDSKGVKIIEKQRMLAGIPGGGFVDYSWPIPGSEIPVQKTAFVIAVKDWQWVVGAGVYLDEIESLIAADEHLLYTRLLKQLLLGVLLLLLIFIIVYIIAQRLSSVIERDFNTFTEKLKNAVSNGSPLNKEDFSTVDLQQVTENINQILRDKSRAEITLRESEARFRTIFENVPVMITLLQHDREYRMGNRELERVLKFHKDDVITKSKIKNLLTDNPINKNFMELFSYSDGQFREVEFNTSNGVRRHHWAQFVTPSGEIIMVGFDVTEMRQAEIRLKELNDMKDKFFSIIAHDLRGPIGSFTSFLEFLTDKNHNHSGPEIEGYLNMMKTSSNSTLFLLDNLLYWARSQRGTLPFKPSSQKICMLIRQNIELYRTTAEKKLIKLTSEVDDDLIAEADPHMLNAIVRNLINNALKFTPSGGEVIVRAYAADEQIVVSVIDNGIGISAEAVDGLFRLDANPESIKGTKGEEGSGLGLVLCREFVEKHGGTIQVDSVVGQGSSFSFSIPLLN